MMMAQMVRPGSSWGKAGPRLALATFLMILGVAVAQAQPTPSATTTATATPSATATATAAASAKAPPPRPSDVVDLELRAKRIRNLLREQLDLSVEPRDLFDIDLGNERAIAVEVERLRKLLGAMAAPVPSATATTTATGSVPVPPPSLPSATATATATASASALPSPAPSASAPIPADEQLLAARIELDRARLRFFELSPERRQALLDAHQKRQDEGREADNAEALSAAEKAKQAAEDEKQRALEEAKATKNEAVRRAAEERARLFGIDSTFSSFRGELAKRKQVLKEEEEQVLAWLRPADELLSKSYSERPPAEVYDRDYDELVAHLRDMRESLSGALDELRVEPDLPSVGDDQLANLTIEVARAKIDELRERLPGERESLLAEARDLRWRRARARLRAMNQLDERRRDLLPFLSGEKSSELAGFNATAVKQARTELGQVGLLLRYHFHETRRFVSDVGRTEEAGDSLLVALITAFKWLLPIGLFVWWRRRAEETLARWRESAEEAATKNRIAGKMTAIERILAFIQRVRRPLEWLLLVRGVFYFLPKGAHELLEVQLLATALTWAFAGWLAVLSMDALLSAEVGGQRRTVLETAELRLRTLRFLGRVVVAFGLVLALTNQLVGHGTIYGWAVKILWFSVVPVAAVVVRWWREVIFRTVEAQRPKGPFLRWVSGSQQGVGGFIAAAAGGTYLLTKGGISFARQYLGNLDLVKRGLAYWFRREVARQAERKGPQSEGEPLSSAIYQALAPESEPPELVQSVADEEVDAIVANVERPEGGVFAVVGERGSGKTTLLRRIHERSPESFVVKCPPEGISGFRLAIREAMGLAPDATSEELRQACDKSQRSILIDDAHHLIRPVVDGLDEIDKLLELSRHSSGRVTWVYAFDHVIWQFLRRAREVRPLFDDIVKLQPWTEEGIVRLLESRSEAAELAPDFGALVSDLPEDADSFQTQEALAVAERRYYRLLWDYSLGNPAVSLHFWRASLRRESRDEGGDHHFVRLFEPPPTNDLERLPDSTVFVLRAVVQLDLASVDDIVEATLLGRGQVEDALRYVAARRYVERHGDRYRLRWTWFRAITRFLARRHLMMGPYT